MHERRRNAIDIRGKHVEMVEIQIVERTLGKNGLMMRSSHSQMLLWETGPLLKI
jgi:hypothetical protein